MNLKNTILNQQLNKKKQIFIDEIKKSAESRTRNMRFYMKSVKSRTRKFFKSHFYRLGLQP